MSGVKCFILPLRPRSDDGGQSLRPSPQKIQTTVMRNDWRIPVCARTERDRAAIALEAEETTSLSGARLFISS